MAFYSLLAQDPKTERWRTCAIFPAGGRAQAARQAKTLRDSNAIGFVPHPAQFRMRGATRREMALLASYMSSVDNSTLPTFKESDLEGLFHRRRKLLNGFFLGLYLQPEVMKRRYGASGGGSSATISSATSSGGVESEMEGAEKEAQAEGNTTSTDAQEAGAASGDTSQSEDAAASDSDAPITDASSQEAALAALESTLADAETEIKSDTSSEIDLDFV